jgi:glycosyltransferase involved in cell wall biosynthesis
MEKKKISIVVPMYNEQESLGILYEELNKVVAGIHAYEFEFLFVNDGSTDGTQQVIRQLSDKDERVRYVSFSRTLRHFYRR